MSKNQQSENSANIQLIEAIQANNLNKVIQILMDHNLSLENGEALNHAVMKACTSNDTTVTENAISIVSTLLMNGANPNIGKELPLALALKTNNTAITELLLKNGADLQLSQNLPLSIFIDSWKQDLSNELLEILINHDKNLTTKLLGLVIEKDGAKDLAKILINKAKELKLPTLDYIYSSLFSLIPAAHDPFTAEKESELDITSLKEWITFLQNDCQIDFNSPNHRFIDALNDAALDFTLAQDIVEQAIQILEADNIIKSPNLAKHDPKATNTKQTQSTQNSRANDYQETNFRGLPQASNKENMPISKNSLLRNALNHVTRIMKRIWNIVFDNPNPEASSKNDPRHSSGNNYRPSNTQKGNKSSQNRDNSLF